MRYSVVSASQLLDHGNEEQEFGKSTLREYYCFIFKVKVKQSLYTPWRRLGGEEV
jgi:hypothetical protein